MPWVSISNLRVIIVFYFFIQHTLKKHDHTGDTESIVWEKEKCLTEVNEYKDGHSINFTDLARRYGVKNLKGKLTMSILSSERLNNLALCVC